MILYYFIGNLNDVFVLDLDERVDRRKFPQYKELTTEQAEYFLAHPDASRYDIEALVNKDNLLITLKNRRLREIEAYDASSEVNVFYINNTPLWLDKDTRTGLSFSVDIEEAAGQEVSTLWYETTCFTLPIPMIKTMLAQLEVYAHDCYNVTQSHISDIDSADSIEYIENYDISAGYPEKIYFTIGGAE